MPCIYKIENKINHKIYIGQTKRTLDWRLNNTWCGHFHKANSGCKSYLCNALRKYGKDNFIYEVIEERDSTSFENKQELVNWLNDREIYWISYYHSNCHEFGYNKTKGGQTGKPNINYSLHSKRMTEYNNAFWSDEERVEKRREQVRQQSIRRWKDSKYREKTIASLKATIAIKSMEEKHISAMKGVETRRKNGTLESSEETKRKISASVTNLWQDPEYAKMQSDNKRGNTNVKGRIHVHTDTDFRMIKPEQLDEFLAKGYVLGSGRSHHHYLSDEEKQARKQKMQERGTLDKLRDTTKAAESNKGSKTLYKDGIKKIFKADKVDGALEEGWLSFYDYLSAGYTLSWVNDGKPVTLHVPKFKLLYKDGRQKRVKLEEVEDYLSAGWLPYKEYLATGGQLSWRFPKRKNNENKI